MKHKTWFRLVIKAIGVLLVVWSLPDLVGAGVTVGMLLNQFRLTGASVAMGYLVGPGIGHLIKLLVGLYLFFGAGWIVDKAIPSNRPYCPECGYQLSASRGDECPECGTKLPSELRGE